MDNWRNYYHTKWLEPSFHEKENFTVKFLEPVKIPLPSGTIEEKRNPLRKFFWFLNLFSSHEIEKFLVLIVASRKNRGKTTAKV